MRALALLVAIGFAAGAACSGPSPTPPQTILARGALRSPGPLAMVHEQLDDAGHCDACHEGFTPVVSPAKCLNCHEHGKLQNRVAVGKGFHATAGVRGKECTTCHRDHKGRRFDLMGWNSLKGGMTGFDHALTGWPLTGKHAPVACESCHLERDRQGLRVFVGTDRQCAVCHRDRQPHGFIGKFACERCHTTAGWAPPTPVLQFDHMDRKDAAFPLAKAHRDVACAKCHPNNVFKLGDTRCERCHGATSPHGTHLFNQRPCDWCHSANEITFKSISFDHDEHGGPLGEHAKLVAKKTLDCYSCHPKDNVKTPVTRTCEGCHAAKSKHGTRFAAFGNPAHCGTCHRISSWRPRFDHSKTKFPLTAKHASIACRDCHRGSSPANFEKLDAAQSTCAGCHAHKNVHDNKYKNDECLKCHVAPGATQIRVNAQPMMESIHGVKGTFPLVDAHKSVPCADCHTGRDANGKTTYAPGLSQECVTCHTDAHKGQNGKTCLGCHTSGTWKAKRASPAPQQPATPRL